MGAGKGSISDLLTGASPSGFMAGIVKGMITWGGQPYPNIATFIRAVQSDSDVNVLATPQILTTDNEEAEIIVGEERPVLTRAQSDTTGLSIIKTYDYKDVGITLRLTPHISKGKFVRLELFQEIKSFVGEAEVGAITTTKRQAKTTVTVEKGQTIVIGGLIQESGDKSVSGVPLLSKIPIFGWLFKARSDTDNKINLMIFITPNIITSLDEIDEVTKKKRLEMDYHINDNGGKTEELEDNQLEELLEDKEDKEDKDKEDEQEQEEEQEGGDEQEIEPL
jgi:general secretion pathway protein D